ncbi:MAG: translation initiation factor [Candidatus Omnitrophica bacterium]|nr:translation initiation factor [Candidatus Omnitrophota bacterium]
MTQSPVAKIRLEKRSGKVVTVITGLHTYGSERLNSIAKALKSSLGTGGTVKEGVIEIQGEHMAAVERWLRDGR